MTNTRSSADIRAELAANALAFNKAREDAELYERLSRAPALVAKLAKQGDDLTAALAKAEEAEATARREEAYSHMSPYRSLRRFGADGTRLATWMALTRWLIEQQAPSEITVAASEMVAGIRRRLRGQPDKLNRGRITRRMHCLAHDALDAWKAMDRPGLPAAVRRAKRELLNQRLPAHS